MDRREILIRLMDISEYNYFTAKDGMEYQGSIYDVTDDVVRMWYGGISWDFNCADDVKAVDEFVVPLSDIDLDSLAYYDLEKRKWVQLSFDEPKDEG